MKQEVERGTTITHKQETLEEAILRIKSENEHYIDEVAFELGAK
jgi:hypothetical protein